MCLLICIRGRDGWLAAAVNRDERYDRPARAPFVWARSPRILAGRDELAGGTWLAVSERGLIAAVTDRPTLGGDDPSRPSRGRLPLLACRCATAAEARDALGRHLNATRYNGFNLFVADADDAFVVQSPGEEAHSEGVPPGVHVVGNGGWNDAADPRVARARTLLGQREISAAPGAREELLAGLTAICRDHESEPGLRTLCMHGEAAGTVSSTVLILGADRRLSRYLHAAGAPCRTDYSDLTAKLATPPA